MTSVFLFFVDMLLLMPYPASRVFSLAWLLTFKKSFMSLVSCVVGLFT